GACAPAAAGGAWAAVRRLFTAEGRRSPRSPDPFGFVEGLLEAPAAFLALARGFLVLAGPFRVDIPVALVGSFLALAGRPRALGLAERVLAVAARFFIIHLLGAPMPPSGHHLTRCPRAQLSHSLRRAQLVARARSPVLDAMIRPMPPAKGSVEFLRSCSVLAALPATELATLATVAREQRYRARDYVF